MLLNVIDLIESGDIPDGWVKYDVRLVSRFRDYWELVLERQRNAPDIPMPFHALGGDKDMIWDRFTADGQPSFAKATTRLCSLTPDLFSIVQVAHIHQHAVSGNDDPREGHFTIHRSLLDELPVNPCAPFVPGIVENGHYAIDDLSLQLVG
jgi:hypothetical protein